MQTLIKTIDSFFFNFSSVDLRQLNDKLVEVSTSKMTLKMKLDELEVAEVNIKVSPSVITVSSSALAVGF